MKKSKSEDISRLPEKDVVMIPPSHYSTADIQKKKKLTTTTSTTGTNTGIDADLGTTYIIRASTSRQGSIRSAYMSIRDDSIGDVISIGTAGSIGTRDFATQTFLDVSLPPAIPPIHHSIIGIILAFTCAIALSSASFLVKFLRVTEPDRIPPSNSAFWRGPLVVSIALVWLVEMLSCSEEDRTVIKEVMWPPTRRGRIKIIFILIISRVICGPASTVTQLLSLEYIDLGDSNTIVFSAAAFVPIFAYCFLKEAWGVVPFFAALITAIGVMIISKPSFITGKHEKTGDNRTIGFLFAFVSMIFHIGQYITLRYLHQLPGAMLVTISSGCSTIIGLILTLSTGGFVMPTTFTAIGVIVALMIVTTIGQFSLVFSLRYENASMVSLIRCSELVFGFLWQMYWHKYPDAFSIGGALLVCFAFVLIFFRKYLQQLPYDDQWRRWFKYILK